MAKRITRPVSKDAMGKEIKTVALIGAGVIMGSIGGKMLDKMLKVNPADTSMNLKKFIRPAALIGAGAFGSLKLGGEEMKNLAKGVAISGMLSAAAVILPKNLLNGLEGFDGFGDTDAYGEPIGILQNVPLYIEPEAVGNADETFLLGEGSAIGSDLDLPELRATEFEETINADDETVGNTVSEELPQITGTANFEELGETVSFEEIL